MYAVSRDFLTYGNIFQNRNLGINTMSCLSDRFKNLIDSLIIRLIQVL